MKSFPVRIISPRGERLLCGELRIDEGALGSRLAWAFRYDSVYLGRPDSHELDPVALPLRSRPFDGAGEPWLPRALNDALPDAWGRRVYARQYGINSKDPRVIIPLLTPPMLGAIRFSPKDNEAARPERLDDLIGLAGLIERGEPVSDDEWQRMGGWGTAGGARPKALITDAEGGHWLAKFPSVDDTVTMAPIESLCLDLAAEAGIAVPDHKLAPNRPDVLLVRRFDVSDQGGRYHRISFETLARGALNSYETGLFLVRRFCADPRQAVLDLYRRMVFNAAIGNTDDHERNLSLLHCGGWRLSPAYDLLPDLSFRGEHAVAFSHSNHPPNRQQCIRLGMDAGIKAAQCERIIDEVVAAVSGFSAGLSLTQCPDDMVMRLSQSVSQRLERLRSDMSAD